MIDKTFRFAIVLVLSLEMMTMSLIGCSGKRHKDRFQWAEFVKNAIEYKAAHKNEPVYFDVRRIMPFGWEKFYVFPPYTTIETIENALGFGWGTAKDTGISERDDITLLVFVIGRSVHEYIEQPRGEGDFSRLKPAHAYTPREAYFELIEEDQSGQPWFVFVDADREI
jgi:hypothetical protein